MQGWGMQADSPDDLGNPAASEEVAAPHLAEAEGEVWTPDPLNPPSRALTSQEKWPGEWHAVCWMYAHGASQNQIAQQLNYSVSRISIILQRPEVHERIEQIRKEFIGKDSLTKRFGSVAPKAMDVLAKVIDGREQAKVSERIDASKWLLEKVTGKAKQEVSVEGGAGILQLLQALDEAKAAAAAPQQHSDIELKPQQAEPKKDPLAEWVSQNVSEVRQEKSDGK